jgi:membrane-bound lytic murein transglycosylase D
MPHDWLLAVAAYNAGDGAIEQALAKNRRAGKPTDFWSLPLNAHTRGYIPQLLALSTIVANPEAYGVKLYPVADRPYFARVNIDRPISLTEAARASALDANLLKKLNAGFSGWLADPSSKGELLVPVSGEENFRLQLGSLAKVASAYPEAQESTSVEAASLKPAKAAPGNRTKQNGPGPKANTPAKEPALTKETALAKEQTLTKEQTLAKQSTPSSAMTQAKPKSPALSASYAVKPGDSLWTIAKAVQIPVATLAQINNLNPKSTLKPGQKLRLLP